MKNLFTVILLTAPIFGFTCECHRNLNVFSETYDLWRGAFFEQIQCDEYSSEYIYLQGKVDAYEEILDYISNANRDD